MENIWISAVAFLCLLTLTLLKQVDMRLMGVCFKMNTKRLFQSWLRGEWGKSRWDKPVRAEAVPTQTCQKCRAAFVSSEKSELCPDCC